MTYYAPSSSPLICGCCGSVRGNLSRAKCVLAVGGKWLPSLVAAGELLLCPAPAGHLSAELRASVNAISRINTPSRWPDARHLSVDCILFPFCFPIIRGCCCVSATLVCRAPSFAGHPRRWPQLDRLFKLLPLHVQCLVLLPLSNFPLHSQMSSRPALAVA